MTRPSLSNAIVPAVEMLIDATDPVDRDRILIEGVLASGIAGAAAIWRLVPAGNGSADSVWHNVLARGPADALPDGGLVEAVHEGRLATPLAGMRTVLLSSKGNDVTALALGGIIADEESLDSLEALLFAHHLVESSTHSEDSQEVCDLLDYVASALPEEPAFLAEEGTGLRSEFRDLVSGIRATEEMLLACEDMGDGSLRAALDCEYADAGNLLIESVQNGEPEAGIVPQHAPRGECEPALVLGALVARERARGLSLALSVDAIVEGRHCARDAQSLDDEITELLAFARESSDATCEIDLALTADGDGMRLELAARYLKDPTDVAATSDELRVTVSLPRSPTSAP